MSVRVGPLVGVGVGVGVRVRVPVRIAALGGLIGVRVRVRSGSTVRVRVGVPGIRRRGWGGRARVLGEGVEAVLSLRGRAVFEARGADDAADLRAREGAGIARARGRRGLAARRPEPAVAVAPIVRRAAIGATAPCVEHARPVVWPRPEAARRPATLVARRAVPGHRRPKSALAAPRVASAVATRRTIAQRRVVTRARRPRIGRLVAGARRAGATARGPLALARGARRAAPRGSPGAARAGARGAPIFTRGLRPALVALLRLLLVRHGAPTFFAERRIRTAANAPPNPLSMFTTVMPDAQLVSIQRSADKPWKLAP